MALVFVLMRVSLFCVKVDDDSLALSKPRAKRRDQDRTLSLLNYWFTLTSEKKLGVVPQGRYHGMEGEYAGYISQTRSN